MTNRYRSAVAARPREGAAALAAAALLCAAAAAVPAPVAADVFRCRDAAGALTFRDRPCELGTEALGREGAAREGRGAESAPPAIGAAGPAERFAPAPAPPAPVPGAASDGEADVGADDRFPLGRSGAPTELL